MKVNGFNPSVNAEGLIAKALSAGRFPHTAIIAGGSAEERLALSEKISKALICCDETEVPCGNCIHCIKADKGFHPDIITYNPRREGSSKKEFFSVNYIREIRDDTFIVPNESEKKIIILADAQTMNEQAQNAFLKVLEEPPRYATFILLTSSENIFLDTILSRAVVWSLGTSGDNEINDIPAEKLKETAESIANAVADGNDLAIVMAAGVFEKDQKLLQATLPVIEEIFAGALRIKFNAEEKGNFDSAQLLAQKLSGKALLRLIECTTELSAALRRNSNLNLTIARLCSLFRAASN